MTKNEILERLAYLPGDIGFYYKDLVSGESFGHRENDMFQAASVIKLPIYAVVMKLWAEGKLSLSEKIVCRDEDKLPPCGALYFFTGDVEVDINTLCGLMISLSDNAATNLLLGRFGLDFFNEEFKKIGLKDTHLERRLFDPESAAQGKENRIVPAEIGELLERIYRHEFVSEDVSREMEKLLLEQQINHKIPGYLPEGTPVAHKTGEDDGITNDVGVVYGEKPFVICFASNFTDVPAAERALREIALALL
jgi:beta-lactamase class A